MKKPQQMRQAGKKKYGATRRVRVFFAGLKRSRKDDHGLPNDHIQKEGKNYALDPSGHLLHSYWSHGPVESVISFPTSSMVDLSWSFQFVTSTFTRLGISNIRWHVRRNIEAGDNSSDIPGGLDARSSCRSLGGALIALMGLSRWKPTHPDSWVQSQILW